MNLQENIHRIKTLMTEDKKGQTIRNMIDTMGLLHTISMVGDYNTIEPYLKEIDKVNFIKEKVSRFADELGGSGFGLAEINESPIFYGENEYELRQIEYLGKQSVYVDVYDKASDGHIGDFKVVYESLPGYILNELVELLINI